MPQEKLVVKLNILGTVKMANGDFTFILTEMPDESRASTAVFCASKSHLESITKLSAERYVDITVTKYTEKEFNLSAALQREGLFSIGALPVADMDKFIRRAYVTYMYQRLYENASKNKQKDFSPSTIFASEELLQFEAIYKHLYGRQLKDEMAATGFQYERKSVYSVLPDGKLHNSERTLWYHPKHDLVIARWTLGRNPADAQRTEFLNLDGTPPDVVSSPIGVFSHYVHHRGTGWTSLKNLWNRDEKLKKFLLSYIEMGWDQGSIMKDK